MTGLQIILIIIEIFAEAKINLHFAAGKLSFSRSETIILPQGRLSFERSEIFPLPYCIFLRFVIQLSHHPKEVILWHSYL